MSPAPNIKYQRISQKTAGLLNEQLDECQYCYALLPVDWHIKEDAVVQPDNLVVCYEPSGTHLTKAPTLIYGRKIQLDLGCRRLFRRYFK